MGEVISYTRQEAQRLIGSVNAEHMQTALLLAIQQRFNRQNSQLHNFPELCSLLQKIQLRIGVQSRFENQDQIKTIQLLLKQLRPTDSNYQTVGNMLVALENKIIQNKQQMKRLNQENKDLKDKGKQKEKTIKDYEQKLNGAHQRLNSQKSKSNQLNKTILFMMSKMQQQEQQQKKRDQEMKQLRMDHINLIKKHELETQINFFRQLQLQDKIQGQRKSLQKSDFKNEKTQFENIKLRSQINQLKYQVKVKSMYQEKIKNLEAKSQRYQETIQRHEQMIRTLNLEKQKLQRTNDLVEIQNRSIRRQLKIYRDRASSKKS